MSYIIAKNININELCEGWEENDTHYKRELFIGSEFIKINKKTREITFRGFKSLISDWKRNKIIRVTMKY